VPKLGVFSGAEIVRILESAGFIRARQKGSHVIMQRRLDGGTITVPVPLHRTVRIVHVAIHHPAIWNSTRTVSGLKFMPAKKKKAADQPGLLKARVSTAPCVPAIREKVEDIVAAAVAVTEGYPTARSAHHLAARMKIETPIVREVFAMLYENKNVRQAVQSLMGRDRKQED